VTSQAARTDGSPARSSSATSSPPPRNLFAAEKALRELGMPSLLDALNYLELLAETKVEKLPGAALR